MSEVCVRRPPPASAPAVRLRLHSHASARALRFYAGTHWLQLLHALISISLVLVSVPVLVKRLSVLACEGLRLARSHQKVEVLLPIPSIGFGSQ